MPTLLFSLAPPSLWDGPTHIRAPTGSSVTFQFQVHGSPEPSVVWEHGDQKIRPSARMVVKTEGGVTSLTITDVARSDEGAYVCCALNAFGSILAESELTVLGTCM